MPNIDYIKTTFPFYNTAYDTGLCDLYNDIGWKAWKHPMTTSLDSFMMKRTGGSVGDAVTVLSLRNLDGTENTDLIGSVAKLTIVTFADGTDYITYNAQENSGAPLSVSAGEYFIRISDGTLTWESVRFQVSSDASSYLNFQWFNTYDIGDVFFDSTSAPESEAQIELNLRIDTNIDLPENELEEKGEYRGDLFIVERSVLKEIYSIEFRALDYVVSALTRAQQYSNLRVSFPNGEPLVTIYDLTVEPEKEADGIAITKVGFRIDSVEKLQCDTNMTKA